MDREKLINIGVDYDEGVERFSGKADMYEEYLTVFSKSDVMKKLKTEIAEDNYYDAYRTAQDIKGSAGNLSMNMLSNVMSELIAELRDSKQTENLMGIYDYAMTLYSAAVKAINEK